MVNKQHFCLFTVFMVMIAEDTSKPYSPQNRYKSINLYMSIFYGVKSSATV